MNSPLHNSDGSWKYTNKLIHASSPYLLQHAHNPVDWYPWGEEAILLAKAEDKPLLVSIGYSTCYWCHVMERQIFCEPAMAERMNRYFINIKIDREERPDLDSIYMAARQLMTREGGWPNNVVLTPDLKPFFAGGTFAIDNRYGKPGFGDIIRSLAELWKNKRDAVLARADEITHYIHTQLAAEKPEYTMGNLPDSLLPDKLFEQLLSYADKANGGFFHAPKFPQESYLLFLLHHYQKTHIEAAQNIVTRALDSMAAGGLYDHVGGGFHRYAVDEAWQVPHFEKMLYNQALLSCCYSEAFCLTQDPYYRFICETILDFATNTMMGADGGFYSALDAETNEVEGAYYAWSQEDISALFSKEEEALFYSCFALAEIPRFDGHKHPKGGVLYVHDLQNHQEHHAKIMPLLARLKAVRKERPLPMLDTKIITAWHSMMVMALARAGMAFNSASYIETAEKSAHFLVKSLAEQGGRLLRIVTRDKQEAIYGFLEDYAFTIQAFLMLHTATLKQEWLDLALTLTEKALYLFEDKAAGGFFFSEATQETLVRIKDADDSALPSANAVMLHNITTLLALTKDPFWHSKAEQLVSAFKHDMHRSPISYTHMIYGVSRLSLLRPDYATLPISGHVQATTIEKPAFIQIGKAFTVTLKLTLGEGWHIYAAGEKSGHVTPTQVAFSSQTPLKILHITYPEGKHYAPLAGEEVAIYKGEAIITASLMLETPLLLAHLTDITILAAWQPCNETRCLAPEQVKLMFSVGIEE